MSLQNDIARQELNEKVKDFYHNIMLLRLINSGKSSASIGQAALVKKTFDMGYEILCAAASSYNNCLFNRIYLSAHEIVPDAEVLSVMKYPRMYNDMLNAQLDFNYRAAALLRRNTELQERMR